MASVYGTPDPALSREQVEKIIADAETHGQNVFFGSGWKHPQQHALPRLLVVSQPPVETGFWAAIAGTIAAWF